MLAAEAPFLFDNPVSAKCYKVSEDDSVKSIALARPRHKFSLIPYLFIAPHVIIFLLFFLFPMVYGFYSSFTKWNLFNDPIWVGISNFKTILSNHDSTFFKQFWNGLGNTVLFVLLCVPFQIALSLFIALAITTKTVGYKLFQSAFYLPTLFSISSVILMWLFIFDRSLGLFNNAFGSDVNWYGKQPYAWITILVVTVWWCIGQNMIIYIAAIYNVDTQLYEACRIDGANSFQSFIHVTIPGIKYQIIYTLVINIVSQFNIYGQPLMLTAGGPNQSTYVLLMYIRDLAFGLGSPVAGMASAMATIMGIIIAGVSAFQLILLRNKDA